MFESQALGSHPFSKITSVPTISDWQGHFRIPKLDKEIPGSSQIHQKCRKSSVHSLFLLILNYVACKAQVKPQLKAQSQSTWCSWPPPLGRSSLQLGLSWQARLSQAGSQPTGTPPRAGWPGCTKLPCQSKSQSTIQSTSRLLGFQVSCFQASKLPGFMLLGF